MKLIFCAVSITIFLCSDSIVFWWLWQDMPKVLKITSMQSLCNISRKNWVMKLMFWMVINMKVFYRLTVLFLTYLTRYIQSTGVNLQYLCDILRKMSVMKLGNYLDWLLQILLSQFIIHSMFSLHWPFSSLNM